MKKENVIFYGQLLVWGVWLAVLATTLYINSRQIQNKSWL